jgi:hypothetical protein
VENLGRAVGGGRARDLGQSGQFQQVVLNVITNTVAMDSATGRPRAVRVGSAREGEAVVIARGDSGVLGLRISLPSGDASGAS